MRRLKRILPSLLAAILAIIIPAAALANDPIAHVWDINMQDPTGNIHVNSGDIQAENGDIYVWNVDFGYSGAIDLDTSLMTTNILLHPDQTQNDVVIISQTPMQFTGTEWNPRVSFQITVKIADKTPGWTKSTPLRVQFHIVGPSIASQGYQTVTFQTNKENEVIEPDDPIEEIPEEVIPPDEVPEEIIPPIDETPEEGGIIEIPEEGEKVPEADKPKEEEKENISDSDKVIEKEKDKQNVGEIKKNEEEIKNERYAAAQTGDEISLFDAIALLSTMVVSVALIYHIRQNNKRR